LKEREKEVQKWREDEKEEMSSYQMILRKREDTGSRKKQYYIALCGELALE
jgi:hypothetical protein